MCIVEYYRDGETCKKCPPQATYEAGTTLSNIHVKKGHYRFTSDAKQIYECLHSLGCKASSNFNDQCEKGYKGPLW